MPVDDISLTASARAVAVPCRPSTCNSNRMLARTTSAIAQQASRLRLAPGGSHCTTQLAAHVCMQPTVRRAPAQRRAAENNLPAVQVVLHAHSVEVCVADAGQQPLAINAGVGEGDRAAG